MTAHRIAACLAATGLALAAVPASPALGEPQAANTVWAGPVYWGAYVPGAPFDVSRLDAFEAASGKKMSIVHWGQPWMMNGAYQYFQTAQYDAVRSRGAIPMVAWGSWELGKGPDQPSFRLANIAAGKYDAYIKEWAQQARAWGQPFLLRFDWEMNGWWQFPWAAQTNGNHPDDYIHAWRRVHQIFAQEGATNATWVWCPNIAGPQTTPLASLYPGDSYVDWTCMDGYNFGTDENNQWQTFSQVFGGSAYSGNHNTYQELLNLAPNKPIVIGETASSEHGGSKAAWISDMLSTLPGTFPQIRALLWFNWNDNNPSLSWPIASSDSARDAFASGIVASAYASNQFGSLPSLAPIPGISPAAADAAPPAPDVIPPAPEVVAPVPDVPVPAPDAVVAPATDVPALEESQQPPIDSAASPADTTGSTAAVVVDPSDQTAATTD